MTYVGRSGRCLTWIAVCFNIVLSTFHGHLMMAGRLRLVNATTRSPWVEMHSMSRRVQSFLRELSSRLASSFASVRIDALLTRAIHELRYNLYTSPIRNVSLFCL